MEDRVLAVGIRLCDAQKKQDTSSIILVKDTSSSFFLFICVLIRAEPQRLQPQDGMSMDHLEP